MSGFHLHALACRETRILDLLGRGRCRGKRLRLKCQRPVRRSRLFSVDRKGQGLSLGLALDVDRSIIWVLYLKVFISSGDRRVHGRLYIADGHGVVLPLDDLKLRV